MELAYPCLVTYEGKPYVALRQISLGYSIVWSLDPETLEHDIVETEALDFPTAFMPMDGLEVSMDVSFDDESATHRVFGKLTGEVVPSDSGPVLLAIEEHRNFGPFFNVDRKQLVEQERAKVDFPDYSRRPEQAFTEWCTAYFKERQGGQLRKSVWFREAMNIVDTLVDKKPGSKAFEEAYANLDNHLSIVDGAVTTDTDISALVKGFLDDYSPLVDAFRAGLTAQDAPLVDVGPWFVTKWDNYRYALQSNDFYHDTAITVSGDFGSDDTRRNYALRLAALLNKASR